MNIAPKARVAIIVALATALLTGCSAAEPSTTNGAATTPATPIVETQPESRRVTVAEIIDPTTIVVTPVKDSDSLFGTKFTVHLNDFNSSAKGECGYDETLAFAKAELLKNPWDLDYSSVEDDVWIDTKGDHYGFLNSSGLLYGQTMIRDGFAYIAPDKEDGSYLGNLQQEAQHAKTGLWATCPDFGK